MNFGKQRIYNLPENDITWLGDYARQLEQEARARGEQLPPAVRLQIGEPSFRTPEHICLAAMQSIEQEQFTYAPAVGWLWLRELLVEKILRVNGYTVRSDNVIVTLGGTGALQTALLATVGEGDEVLIPDPGWPLYGVQLAVCGAVPVRYPLDPQNEWLPDIERMEQLITPRTRLLLINTPGNPTGAVFPPATIEVLLNFARRHHLYLLSDESYDQIVFEGQHVSPATLLSPAELEEGQFIGVYTFSKTYSMTGWRIGYLVVGSQLSKTIADVTNGSYTNISTLVQRAAVAALTG